MNLERNTRVKINSQALGLNSWKDGVITAGTEKIWWGFGGTVKVNVAQSCLTLCDPLDYTVHGILQARILEWIAFPFSR